MCNELFLTARQKIKKRNAFINNMPTDIKLSKTQLSRIIQSGGFLSALFIKFAGLLMKVAGSLTEHVLASLATVASASSIDGAIQTKSVEEEQLR